MIETPRLRLRPWRPADLVPFAALNADPAVMAHFPAPLTRPESDALATRIMADMAARGFGLWAVERRGGPPFLGFVGLSVPRFAAAFTPCVEIAWRLARAQWGQGIATEAAAAALDHGFGALGLPEVVAFTVRENARSRRVMERLGLRHDMAGDFDHPGLPPGHVLRPHVLYRLTAPAWRTNGKGPA